MPNASRSTFDSLPTAADPCPDPLKLTSCHQRPSTLLRNAWRVKTHGRKTSSSSASGQMTGPALIQAGTST